MTLTFDEQRTEPQKKYDAAVMERVKQGMALLEREYGPDWVEHITPDKLDLRSGASCVLGQVYGTYVDGLRTLWPGLAHRVDDEDMTWDTVSQTLGVEFGFFADKAVGPSDHPEEWKALDAAWQDALNPQVTTA